MAQKKISAVKTRAALFTSALLYWPVTLALLVLAAAFPGSTAYSQNITATVDVGLAPIEIAVNPVTNRIYVANFNNDNISVIDGSSNQEIATIEIGAAPQGICVNPATNRIYVTHDGDDRTFDRDVLTVIDGSTNQVIDTFKTSVNLEWVDVNPSTNTVYTNGSRDTSYHWIIALDGATNEELATIELNDDMGKGAINPVTNRIYIINGQRVKVIDGATNEVISTIGIGIDDYYMSEFSSVSDICVDTEANLVYGVVWLGIFGTRVVVIDGATNKVIDDFTIPSSSVYNASFGIALNPATDRIYVANFDYLFFELQIPVAGKAIAIDASSQKKLAAITVGSQPIAFGVNADTGRIYVANAGGNTVSVIDEDLAPPMDDGGDTCPLYFLLGGGSPSGRAALKTIRGFRDRVLARSPAGRQLIASYYQHAAQVTWIIMADADLRSRARAVVADMLGIVRAQRPGDSVLDMVTYSIPPGLQRRMNALIDDIANRGNDKLCSAVTRARTLLYGP